MRKSRISSAYPGALPHRRGQSEARCKYWAKVLVGISIIALTGIIASGTSLAQIVVHPIGAPTNVTVTGSANFNPATGLWEYRYALTNNNVPPGADDFVLQIAEHRPHGGSGGHVGIHHEAPIAPIIPPGAGAVFFIDAAGPPLPGMPPVHLYHGAVTLPRAAPNNVVILGFDDPHRPHNEEWAVQRAGFPAVFVGAPRMPVPHVPSEIPTLTEWGLIIFGVVLLGFITWAFLRRRKVVGVRA